MAVSKTDINPSTDQKRSLSILSFNMSLGYEYKLPQILEHAENNNISVVCLQETGILSKNPATLSKDLIKKYKLYPCFNESSCNKHHTTAICVHQNLKHNVTRIMHHQSGRLMAVEFTFKNSETLSVMNVYMPSGLDNSSETSQEFDQAQNILNKIGEWQTKTDHQILCGDFNETLTSIDRFQITSDWKNPKFQQKPKARFLSQLLNSESFFDVEFPISKMPQEIWTNIASRQHLITCSRLDRFLVSDQVLGKIQIFKIFYTSGDMSANGNLFQIMFKQSRT